MAGPGLEGSAPEGKTGLGFAASGRTPAEIVPDAKGHVSEGPEPSPPEVLQPHSVPLARRGCIHAQAVLKPILSSRGRGAEPGTQNYCRIKGLHRRRLWIPGLAYGAPG